MYVSFYMADTFPYNHKSISSSFSWGEIYIFILSTLQQQFKVLAAKTRNTPYHEKSFYCSQEIYTSPSHTALKSKSIIICLERLLLTENVPTVPVLFLCPHLHRLSETFTPPSGTTAGGGDPRGSAAPLPGCSLQGEECRLPD